MPRRISTTSIYMALGGMTISKDRYLLTDGRHDTRHLFKDLETESVITFGKLIPDLSAMKHSAPAGLVDGAVGRNTRFLHPTA